MTDPIAHLEESALLSHAQKHAGKASGLLNIYYGVSVSQHDEPVEQLAAFLIARRIQERCGGEFYPYIAGRYLVLNTREIADLSGCAGGEVAGKIAESIIDSEERKIRLFKDAMAHFRLKGRVIGSDEVWDDAEYRSCVGEIWKRYGQAILAKPPFAEPKLKLADIPQRLRGPFSEDGSLWAELGEVRAARLYTLAEVAEALYLSRKYGVNAKLGPSTERPFDSFIGDFCHILHFRQPVDLETTKACTRTISPYIAPREQPRIYVGGESKESVARKLAEAETRCGADPALLADPATGTMVFNPMVQYAVYAVEAARATGNAPIAIAGRQVSSGAGVVRLAEQAGMRGWAPDVANALWAYLIEPLKARPG